MTSWKIDISVVILSCVVVFLARLRKDDITTKEYQITTYILVGVMLLLGSGNAYLKHEEKKDLKKQADDKEELLNKELTTTKVKLQEVQDYTNNNLYQYSTAILDILHSSEYQGYGQFRIGLMYYWTKRPDYAETLFRHQGRDIGWDIPTRYNHGLAYAEIDKKADAKEEFDKIDITKLKTPEKRDCVLWWQKLVDPNTVKLDEIHSKCGIWQYPKRW